MGGKPSALALATLLFLSAISAGVGGVAAATQESPRFETDVAEPVLQPGTTQQLTIQLTNDAADYGDSVETARDVEVTVEGTEGIEVLSGARELGAMDDGATRPVTVQVDVPADIPGGEHEIPLTVEYRDEDDDLVTATTTATVRVRERARFAVRSVDASAPVGGSGTVAVTVANVGEETADGAVVQFQSANSVLTFGGSATARRFVGEWEPNESRTVEVDASFADAAETRDYAVDATVEYETPGGTAAVSRKLSFGVTPLAEQTFGVENLTSTLRVGEEGRLRGALTNTGERTVTNAVLLLETTNPNVSPLESEVAVGTLDPGESAAFAFDVEVSDAAEAGPRQFTLRPEYRDPDGTRRAGDPIDAPVSVAEPRAEFAVSAVDANFPAGDGGTLRLEVTNNREETVRDVSAKLFLDAPLSSTDDEGFVDELEPGETETVAFDLSVAESALADKTYPATVDFRYETSDGDTLISDSYRVPVRATDSEGDDLPLGLLGAGALVAVGLVGLVYLRRNG